MPAASCFYRRGDVIWGEKNGEGGKCKRKKGIKEERNRKRKEIEKIKWEVKRLNKLK
jgi:hypothetical protein